MLFQAQGLITMKGGNHNVSFLIDGSSENTIRVVCARRSIAVFSLTQYTSPADTFGKVYFRFFDEGETLTMYTEYEKARDAYDFFREAGFDISYINNSAHPLSEGDVERVVVKLKADYDKKHDPQNNEHTNYLEKFTNLVINQSKQETDTLKLLATNAVNDANEVQQKLVGVGSQYITKIKNAEDELKKVRLGLNSVKIREAIGALYSLLEEAEMYYLQAQKEHEMKIMEGSTVTYLDIVAERERFQKAKKIHKAGATKSSDDAFYSFFGTLGLYQRLLGKDIDGKTKDIVTILDTTYDVIITGVLMAMILLSILQLINTSLYGSSFFSQSFVQLGIMGLCSWVLLQYKRQNLKNLIIIGPICIALYFVLYYVIYINFGL